MVEKNQEAKDEDIDQIGGNDESDICSSSDASFSSEQE